MNTSPNVISCQQLQANNVPNVYPLRIRAKTNKIKSPTCKAKWLQRRRWRHILESTLQ